jgi:O-antigen ligase
MPPVAKERPTIERALFWIFVGGLAWCPFWFGSNDLIAWGINAVIFPFLVLAYELSLVLRRRPHPVGLKAVKYAAGLYCAVVIWILVQNAGWTPEAWHHPAWKMAAEALEQPVGGSISVNRDLTALALMRLMTAASVFWLSLQLCRDQARAQTLIRSLAAIAAAYAAYGIIAAAIAPDYVLWLETTGATDSVRSTFANRNNYATYDGIGAVIIAGLLLQLYGDTAAAAAGNTRLQISTFIETTGRQGAVLLGAGSLVLLALILTGSRGGIIATLVGLAALATLTVARRKGTERGVQRTAIVLILLLIVVAFAAFGNVLAGRLEFSGLSDESRISVYIIALRSIFSAPILGYGYGTFADVFPMFRDRSIGVLGQWTMAHNTYLEVFQGLGVVFGTMLLGVGMSLVVRCLKGAVKRRNALLPIIAASVGFLVAVHALVDFSLQIQAVTLTVMAVLGAGIAQAESSRLALAD